MQHFIVKYGTILEAYEKALASQVNSISIIGCTIMGQIS